VPYLSSEDWKKKVFNGGKILGASVGELVPWLGAGGLRSAPRCTQKIHYEGQSPAPWPINRLHISVAQCTRNKISMEEKFSVPRPVNRCYISVPVGSEVYKKKIMKQTLRCRGQLIGCISWFHSNKKEVFNGEKILGASAGQSVPYLGATRLRGVPEKYIMKQTLRRHSQLIGCISWFHSNKKEVFNGGKILGASVPRPVTRCLILAPIGPEVYKKSTY